MIYCWKCGDRNPDHYRFCGNCGTPAQPRRRPEWAAVPAGSLARDDPARKSIMDRVRRLLDKTIDDARVEVVVGSHPDHAIELIHMPDDVKTGKRIIFKDESGQFREYATIDDVPAKYRSIVKLALQEAKKWPSAPSGELIGGFPFGGAKGPREDRMMIVTERSSTPGAVPPPPLTGFDGRRPESSAFGPSQGTPFARTVAELKGQSKRTWRFWLFWGAALFLLYKLLS